MRSNTLLPLILLVLWGCSALKKTPEKDYSQVIYLKNDADSTAILDSLRAARAEKKKNEISKNDQQVKTKYAYMLQVAPDSIKNLMLYRFIDEWLYTRYLWGGTTKNGIDCSAFMQRLYADVFRLRIPRTSIQQFYTDNVEPFRHQEALSEGDLVFFKTLPGMAKVTHVGMYLGNNMFVNSSSSRGVSIASLRDRYWAQRYVGAGRLIVKKSMRII